MTLARTNTIDLTASGNEIGLTMADATANANKPSIMEDWSMEATLPKAVEIEKYS